MQLYNIVRRIYGGFRFGVAIYRVQSMSRNIKLASFPVFPAAASSPVFSLLYSIFSTPLYNSYVTIYPSKTENNTSPVEIDNPEPTVGSKTNSENSPELKTQEKKPSIKKEAEKKESKH